MRALPSLQQSSLLSRRMALLRVISTTVLPRWRKPNGRDRALFTDLVGLSWVHPAPAGM
jgi:hypothetical protein